MKRFVLILCFLIAGIVSANPENYPPITPENAARLQEVNFLGTGASNPALAWSPDGKIVVGGKYGLYVYENLQAEPQFIELEISVKSLLFAGETLFYSDDYSLYAYDLANQRLLYLVNGQRPLAISQSGTMLAYEVDLGVNILDIATGDILYELDYASLGWSEAAVEVDEYYEEYRFYSAQFFADDSEIVVTWMNMYVGGWEGRSDTGTQFWKLEDLSWMDSTDYIGRNASSGFMGMDSNDEPIMQRNFELEDGCRAIYTFDFEIRSIVAGNLYAVACEEGTFSSGETHTGIWNWQTGEQIAVLPEIGVMRFSPDLSQIAIDNEIYDIATGQSLADLQSTYYEFLGRNILEYNRDNRLRVLDANSYEEMAVLPISSEDLLYRSRGMFLHQNQREAYWIDEVTGQTLAHFTAESPIIQRGSNWNFNASRTFALSRNPNHDEIHLWSVATGQLVTSDEYRVVKPWFYDEVNLLIQTSDSIALYNPVDESISWRFSYEGNFTELWLEPEYLFIFGEFIEIYARETGELLLSLPNTYGDSEYFAWSGDKIAYYDGNDIVILSFPDGAEIQRILPERYGYLEIFENTLIIRDEFSYGQQTYYDIASGELGHSPQRNFAETPCIETEQLNFFCLGYVRIEDKEGMQLMETPMAFVELEAILSNDESRLLILYPEGTISVWAVPE